MYFIFCEFVIISHGGISPVQATLPLAETELLLFFSTHPSQAIVTSSLLTVL